MLVAFQVMSVLNSYQCSNSVVALPSGGLPCRALLGILSDFLPRAGTRSLLLALPSQDAKEAAVLGKPYGLQPLPRTRLAALKDEFPTIAAYSDTAFLVKDVPGASRAARLTGRDEGGLVSGEREREGGYGVSVSGWGRRLRGVVTLGLWR